MGMKCCKCKQWDNKLTNPKLKDCINTDCDMGNRYSELGVCILADRLEYFDHECDGCGTPRELNGLGF
jgi:hypothetical protein